MALRGEIPRRRLARSFVRNALRLGPRSGEEPELPAGIDTLATLLHTRVPRCDQGQVAPQQARAGRAVERCGSGPHRARLRIREWEPPDAGGDTKAERFGGGDGGDERGQGWDEDYTRQMESWLARADLPEPFCLIFSLVNPHDVLGYPAPTPRAVTARRPERSGCGAAADIEEDLREKPAVQALSKLGMDTYLGPLRTPRRSWTTSTSTPTCIAWSTRSRPPARRARLGAGPVVASLTDRDRPNVGPRRDSGFSHGGLRQKIFNAYEETIRVPLVVSSPRHVRCSAESDALVSLVDIVPTLLGLAGPRRRPARTPRGVRPRPPPRGEREVVRDAVLYTYDDHRPGRPCRTVRPAEQDPLRARRPVEVRGLP